VSSIGGIVAGWIVGLVPFIVIGYGNKNDGYFVVGLWILALLYSAAFVAARLLSLAFDAVLNVASTHPIGILARIATMSSSLLFLLAVGVFLHTQGSIHFPVGGILTVLALGIMASISCVTVEALIRRVLIVKRITLEANL
jgi:hypothetical protein